MFDITIIFIRLLYNIKIYVLKVVIDMIKLLCFPYAGGTSAIYAKWKRHISKEIELCPIELAGRGKRYEAPLYNSLDEVIEDVYNVIKNDIDNDYAFFGHSMGCLIAYELAHKIQKLGKDSPSHIFFSGKRAPHTQRVSNDIYLLPDEEFKNEILSLGGTPKEILEHKELYELFIPILRADFKVNDTYEYVEPESKLDCNITVLNGKEDKITLNEIIGWKQHTSKDCKIYMMDGGHFYLNDKYEDIIKIINHTLVI